MIERIVWQIIKDRVDWFKADPDRVYQFFLERMGLDAVEARKVQDYFSMEPDKLGQWGGPPDVIHNFPRVTGPFPCYSVVLLSDQIGQKYLGDDADEWGDDYVDLDEVAANKLAIYVKYQIEVGVYVPDNPDICVYYYHLLRSIMFGATPVFHANDCQNVEFSGRDVQPLEKYQDGPGRLLLRTLTVSMERDELGSEVPDAGTSVGGVFLDDGITVAE